jgi:hypothetical protein
MSETLQGDGEYLEFVYRPGPSSQITGMDVRQGVHGVFLERTFFFFMFWWRISSPHFQP